jgi:hypothetical protein
LNVIDVLARFDVTARADCVQRLRVKTAHGAGLCRSLPTIAAPTASKNRHMKYFFYSNARSFIWKSYRFSPGSRDPRLEDVQFAATRQTAVVTRAIRQWHLAMADGRVRAGGNITVEHQSVTIPITKS